ncbi:hypothetical protein TIFTF001_026893 [Ficus carica]|uniref:Uncharacterized protein n=1 Tax=Ficus carica TaxID=3494 RepID=A0AA88IU79_FICCA|nr:hypothetical protein TIFTF001_026893 [Ficus carica]
MAVADKGDRGEGGVEGKVAAASPREYERREGGGAVGGRVKDRVGRRNL